MAIGQQLPAYTAELHDVTYPSCALVAFINLLRITPSGSAE